MTYSISEAAKQMGVSVHTLRYYDKEGLLPFVERVNGRRVFKDSDFSWLKIISCLKNTGMPLKEIRRYMELCQLGDASLLQRQEIILAQKRSIEEQIRFLQDNLELISYKARYDEKAVAAGTEAVCTEQTCEEKDEVI